MTTSDSLLTAFDEALEMHPNLLFELGYCRITGWMVHVWDAHQVGNTTTIKIINTQSPSREEAITDAIAELTARFSEKSAESP